MHWGLRLISFLFSCCPVLANIHTSSCYWIAVLLLCRPAVPTCHSFLCASFEQVLVCGGDGPENGGAMLGASHARFIFAFLTALGAEVRRVAAEVEERVVPHPLEGSVCWGRLSLAYRTLCEGDCTRRAASDVLQSEVVLQVSAKGT